MLRECLEPCTKAYPAASPAPAESARESARDRPSSSSFSRLRAVTTAAAPEGRGKDVRADTIRGAVTWFGWADISRPPRHARHAVARSEPVLFSLALLNVAEPGPRLSCGAQDDGPSFGPFVAAEVLAELTPTAETPLLGTLSRRLSFRRSLRHAGAAPIAKAKLRRARSTKRAARRVAEAPSGREMAAGPPVRMF